MAIGHVVLKIDAPYKKFDVSSQYLHKPCKAYVYCWENKYMSWLKNHLPSRAHNHKILCALGQDLHASGMRALLNVKPCGSPDSGQWKLDSPATNQLSLPMGLNSMD